MAEGDSINVTILRKRSDTKYFYHIMPPEYALSEEHHVLLSLARNVIIEHRPKAEEFTDPEKTREGFFNVSRDLLSELPISKGIDLSHRDLNKLARILVRYTIRFVLLEIMPNVRIITVEDTLELSFDAMRKLGYDILRMKVRSALTSATSEVEAAEGIRTSLRLGDSALIIGEVRSEEAKALYEAMRVGALANVVAGTIHGDSPYGVFDRVVNDLGVPETSFKATDIIIIANPVKTPDGLHSNKRVISLTEVRKFWTKDPIEEAGFVDLLRYNVDRDEIEPTAELMNGSSEIIKNIAGNVKGWAGNWDAVYNNILLRGLLHQALVDKSI